MKLDLFRVLNRVVKCPVDDRSFVMKIPVLTISCGEAAKHVQGAEVDLYYLPIELNMRWPVKVQFQLHIMRYEVGGFLCEHTDTLQEGERQYRFQFILENAARGGELVCEHFIVNWRWFKLFEPGRFKHQVTKVEAGKRRLLNFGVRVAPKSLKTYPF